jgi:hypothetical protein
MVTNPLGLYALTQQSLPSHYDEEEDTDADDVEASSSSRARRRVEQVMDAVQQLVMVSPSDQDRYLWAAGTALGYAGYGDAFDKYRRDPTRTTTFSSNSSHRRKTVGVAAGTFLFVVVCCRVRWRFSTFTERIATRYVWESINGVDWVDVRVGLAGIHSQNDSRGTPSSVFASSLEAMIYYTKVAVALGENTRQYKTIQYHIRDYRTIKYNTRQYIQYSGNIRIITDPVSLDYVLRDVVDLDCMSAE